MRLTAQTITIDCAEPGRLARWWARVLATEEPTDYGDFFVVPATPLKLGFQRVPEPKQVKNRVHLDFTVPDRAAEVARLTDLGAEVVGEGSVPGELSWTVLADPAGNEFCVAEDPG